MKRGAYKLHNDPQIVVTSKLMMESCIRSRRWTRSVDYNELMIRTVVGWGRASGRLMDISSISNIVELPRTTVKRVLDRLERAGEFISVLDGRRRVFFLKEEAFTAAQRASFDLLMIEHIAHIKNAARLLSKMEGSALPQK